VDFCSLDPAGQGVAAAPLRSQSEHSVTVPDRTVHGDPHLEFVDGEVLELAAPRPRAPAYEACAA